jgi:hypothetical protein
MAEARTRPGPTGRAVGAGNRSTGTVTGTAAAMVRLGIPMSLVIAYGTVPAIGLAARGMAVGRGQ